MYSSGHDTFRMHGGMAYVYATDRTDRENSHSKIYLKAKFNFAFSRIVFPIHSTLVKSASETRRLLIGPQLIQGNAFGRLRVQDTKSKLHDIDKASAHVLMSYSILLLSKSTPN